MAAKTDLEKANEKIEILNEELDTLSEKCELLEQENDHLAEKLDLIDESTVNPTESIRTQLLLALAPQMDINHARPEAQRVMKAADEVLKVWGIE
jgi:predicted nuclease with TOPRIM domain